MIQTHPAARLFEGWDETLIWTCLDGIMGQIISSDDGKSAMAEVADFAFFAGTPDKRLLTHRFSRNFMLLVPRTEEWAAAIEEFYGDAAAKVTRYATLKTDEGFDLRKLRAIVSNLPEGCILRGIDEEIFRISKATPWMHDWTDQFDDYEQFRRLGLGVVLIRNGEIVSGASTYTRYSRGIEIQIDTHKDCRGMGYASITGASLMLEALDRGLYPSWDAANLISLRLAEKLGYRFSHAYHAYALSR